MIIDCHGHYTTAPAAHQKFRDAQIAVQEKNAQPISFEFSVSGLDVRELE